MGFRRFLILYTALVSTPIILLFLYSMGMFYQTSSVLLILLGGFFVIFPLFVLEKVITQRLSVRVTKASLEELQREDDVLLQAVAFSQTILFFFVNLTIQEETAKYLLSAMIAVFAILFYILRAFGKIRDSPKYRYHSMNVFALLSGTSVYAFLLVVINQFIPLQLSLEHPHIFILLIFCSSIGKLLQNLARNVFKIRYGA